ncbi:uncharacterized protein J3D65DRAFT_602314 [Phyllosticta citribraziliensis]|uniref:Uncharacterized protein n=1 Tax=Phyllosticta citribraziliensis TaxID=989973 RepID=A0ABR1LSY4_9PEZI
MAARSQIAASIQAFADGAGSEAARDERIEDIMDICRMIKSRTWNGNGLGDITNAVELHPVTSGFEAANKRQGAANTARATNKRPASQLPTGDEAPSSKRRTAGSRAATNSINQEAKGQKLRPSPDAGNSQETLAEEPEDEPDRVPVSFQLAVDRAKFPDSRMTFYDGGESIVDLSHTALQNLAHRPLTTAKELKDVEYVRDATIYLCKVLGIAGIEALRRKMSHLRESRPVPSSQEPITSAVDVPTELRMILQNLFTGAGYLASFENKEYVLCKSAAELARLWHLLKERLAREDDEYTGFIEQNEDCRMLKRDNRNRTNEALCLGWLTLQYHPHARHHASGIRTKEFAKAREQIKHKIGAGEHMMLLEDYFGDAVFLLILPGWTGIFKKGRCQFTQQVLDDIFLEHCPDLPAICRQLAPAASGFDQEGGSLPKFEFEIPGALDGGNLSLAHLLSTVEGGANPFRSENDAPGTVMAVGLAGATAGADPVLGPTSGVDPTTASFAASEHEKEHTSGWSNNPAVIQDESAVEESEDPNDTSPASNFTEDEDEEDY